MEGTFLVVEEGTQAPLGDARAVVAVLRDGLWLTLASVQTGPEGRGSGRFLTGERYRVTFYRRPRKGLTHDLKEVEVVPAGGRFEASVSLVPVAKAVR